MPSSRAVSITLQPSRCGSIRSRTQTSGASKRRAASPCSPFAIHFGEWPAASRWRTIPSAITSSSSMIRTLGTLARILRLGRGEDSPPLRTMVESAPEAAIVLDTEGRVASLSAAAAEAGLARGDEVVARAAGESEFRRLRVGFTAAVSHELRTPLARLLALIDNSELPNADPRALLDAARV